MKSKLPICVIVSLSPLLLAPFFAASAQSGRVAPTPTPTESSKRVEAKPKFVGDPNADKYKLLFSRGYEDDLLYKNPPKDKKEEKAREKEREKDAGRRIKAYWANFVDHLNEVGDQGYKVISIARQGTVAIARLDETLHEYEMFDTGGKFFFATGGFEQQYTELTKRGFWLIDHLFSSSLCESENTSYDEHGAVPQIFPPRCEYNDRFLIGREKGGEIPRQFTLARHVPRWRAWKSDTSLTTMVNDYLAIGYYPTHALSKYEILLQPIADKKNFSPGMLEAQVFTGSSQNIQKKANDLAQQGYRLTLTRGEIAVMLRNGKAKSPTSYIWLDAWSKGKENKGFEAQLAQTQSKDAIYRMIYTNIAEYKFTLVFEQPAVSDGKRREYKVLGFQLQETENVEQKKVDIDLTPESKENLKTLNRLVKEGFEVRDLFDLTNASASKVGILLERSR